MAAFNKVILMGNLTRDPELRYTPDGMAICNFGIAVNDSYRRGSDGDAKDETMFIDVATFRKQAENCGQYLKKGRRVLIEGRLRLERWQAQDGANRSKHTVSANVVQFLSVGEERSGSNESTSASDSAPSKSETVNISAIDDISDDEIPF
ncbi:MAG: single-stranded DNA-binding protein [bacterium]|nr:single-stranded DNA-binding protein [bacterium]